MRGFKMESLPMTLADERRASEWRRAYTERRRQTTARSLAMEGSISTSDRPGSRVDRLLEFWRPYQARRLTRRELWVHGVAAAGFLAIAVGLVVAVDSRREMDWGVAIVIVLTYAFASRVRMYLGSGYAMPNELVLVPALYLLPVDAVPLLLACTLAGTSLIDSVLGRAHPERVVTAVADAWYVVGGVLVFLAAGEPDPTLSTLPVLIAALAAQFAFDLVSATTREWLGRRIAPGDVVRVILSVYRVDVGLAPAGLAIAIAAEDHDYAFLLGVPLLALFAVLALD